MSARDLAEIDLDLRPTVPASWLRLAAGAAALLAVLLVGFQGWQYAVGADGLWDGFGSPQLAGWSVAFGILASVWIVWRTQDHVAPALAVGLGFAALASDDGVTWRTFLLAALILVMLRVSALVGGLSWDARVEVDVLRPVVRSTGCVLVVVVVAGAVAWVLDGTSAPDTGMKVLGVAAVVGAALWLLPKTWLRGK